MFICIYIYFVHVCIMYLDILFRSVILVYNQINIDLLEMFDKGQPNFMLSVLFYIDLLFLVISNLYNCCLYHCLNNYCMQSNYKYILNIKALWKWLFCNKVFLFTCLIILLFITTDSGFCTSVKQSFCRYIPPFPYCVLLGFK